MKKLIICVHLFVEDEEIAKFVYIYLLKMKILIICVHLVVEGED